MNWQFWIDVGGTFTDCIGRAPDGTLHTCKVLSNGRVKGRVGRGSNRRFLCDPALRGEPEQFFRGYTLTFFSLTGRELQKVPVEAFRAESGKLVLAGAAAIEVSPGMSYELSSGEEAPLLAIRKLLRLTLKQAIPPVDIYLGTTVGTNALLERKGAPTAYVTTKGFGDLLEIGTQARPELFRLHIVKPPLLYREVVELEERIDAQGNVLKALREAHVKAMLRPLCEKGIASIAICLLNAVWNTAHERLVARVAEQTGFRHISVSHRITPTIKFLDRGDTTVVDAYLSPVFHSYVRSIRRCVPGGKLKLMTSAGGLVSAEKFLGKDSILSGPAGGVVGFSEVARRAGFPKAIGFDMGGTSTDVSRFDGGYEYQFTSEKAGVRIVAPMYAIETVAAGGGSICSYNEQRLLVGPESAGADPGPACYGRGGPLTMTDINFFNGKIDETHFPFPLQRQVVQEKLQEIARSIEQVENRRLSLAEIADGFTRVANLKMATAIKRISSARGYDPREYLLVSFGAAASQHACAIARLLGIRTILLHPLAGILSAYGIGMADVRRFAEKTVLKRLKHAALRELAPEFRQLEENLIQEVLAEGVPEELLQPPVRYLDLRYAGEESTIPVRNPANGQYREAFERQHQQLYGYQHHDREIEIVTMRVEVVGSLPKPEFANLPAARRKAGPLRMVNTYFDARPFRSTVYERKRLRPGDHIQGPAVITEAFSTILVDPGWSAHMTERSDLILTDHSPVGSKSLAGTERDPVRLELFNHHFTHIATQMGITLQKTALSVNVKERLDFSCAILSAAGDLVVNAPHIPVHLGAMSEAVKGLLADVPQLNPGEVYLSNDPDCGGSHLPDLTVITPVFDEFGGELRFFCASRAHHAEIGGIYPGSAYPFAANLAQEGVVFRNLKIVESGVFLEKQLRDSLTSAPYPSRLPRENLADIRAALAANQVGVRELSNMIARYSWPVVKAYMHHIHDAAAEKVVAALQKIGSGEYRFRDRLDDGSLIKVRLAVRPPQLLIDFSGSAAVNAGSLNANRAVVQSAIIYCLRCLLDEDIPLNSGMLAPVVLVLPKGMLNPPPDPDPSRHAAIFAGNVEISQRLVDVIFGALGVAAASQGTMNNFIFGDEQCGYYETICGGSGAVPGFDGASAVHTHMTNTRLTDVEILEQRYPLRIRRFQIRRDSGGKGRWRGGEGVIREIEFLKAMEVSLLTQRRLTAPYGLAGGEPGKPGQNLLRRREASRSETLPPMIQLSVGRSDSITLLTPGGGGYGK